MENNENCCVEIFFRYIRTWRLCVGEIDSDLEIIEKKIAARVGMFLYKSGRIVTQEGVIIPLKDSIAPP